MAHRRTWLHLRSPVVGLAFVAGAALVFAGAWRTSFIGDDFEGVAAVRSGPSWSWLWGTGQGGHSRPVVWASLWLDHRLWGRSPAGWHVLPIACHGIAAWMVALVVAAVAVGTADQRRWWGLLAGATFLVAPNHAEPVAWIAGRGDPLATVVVLACLLAWIRARGGDRRWAAASLGALVLAFATKETVVTFPFVLLAFEVVVASEQRPTARERLRAARWRLVAAFAIAGAFVVRTLLADPGLLSGSGATVGGGPVLAARRGVQVVVRSVLPGLPRPGWAVVAVLGVVAAAVLALGRARWAQGWGRLVAQARPLAFLALATVVLAVPVAGFGVGMFGPAGERLAYLPSAFAFGAVGLVLGALAGTARRVAWTGAVVVLVGALLAATATQVYVRGGRVSDRLVAAGDRLDPGRGATILVAPDTVQGAWVQRDGLDASLHLVQGWPDHVHVDQLVGATFPTADHGVVATAGPCARCLTLRPSDPRAELLVPGGDLPADARAGVRVVQLDRHRVVFELDPRVGPDAPPLFYVSDERYVPVARSS